MYFNNIITCELDIMVCQQSFEELFSTYDISDGLKGRSMSTLYGFIFFLLQPPYLLPLPSPPTFFLFLFWFFWTFLFLSLNMNPFKNLFLRSDLFDHVSRTSVVKQHHQASLISVTMLFVYVGWLVWQRYLTMPPSLTWQDKTVTPVVYGVSVLFYYTKRAGVIKRFRFYK